MVPLDRIQKPAGIDATPCAGTSSQGEKTMSDLMLDVGSANELKLAFRRAGWTPDDVKRLGEGDWAAKILPFLRGNAVVAQSPRLWSEADGVVTFSVTSDGTNGKAWIKRLEENGLRVGDYAKRMLGSAAFRPTMGVATQISVLKGELFADNDRVTRNIRTEADRRKLEKPNAEVACLIREMLTDQDLEAMGLWYIVAMHEPIDVSGDDPYLLAAHRGGDGRWLSAYHDLPDRRWFRYNGFAFVSPRVP